MSRPFCASFKTLLGISSLIAARCTKRSLRSSPFSAPRLAPSLAKYGTPSELRTAFAAEGYQMIDRWRAMELSLKLPLFPKLSVPFYSGLYFSRTR